MTKHSTFLLVLFLLAFGANAQYCSPTFANGCFSWSTQSVTLGSLVWDLNGGNCEASDQTALSTSITAGSPLAMSVTSGTWCGCAVWVDLDHSDSFEDTENLYTIYVGGDPTYTYEFPLTIPDGTLPGTYRMRLISPWGSDGITVGDNGYGPCGAYQYGSFQDFTLDVTTPTSVREEALASAFTIHPNPSNDQVTLTPASPFGQGSRVRLEGVDGRTVRTWNAAGSAALDMDLTNIPAGVYLVRNEADPKAVPVRLVKQ